MGYDRDDSFPFNFEPNGIPFGLKLNGKQFVSDNHDRNYQTQRLMNLSLVT